MGESEPTWQTVQLLAALGISCEQFTDPNVQPPPVELGRPRGRPCKAEDAEGKAKQKK
jgi:hypothetical protein